MSSQQPDKPLRPNYDAALDFLKRWEPQGPWVLTALRPDKKKPGKRQETVTVFASEPECVREFIEEWNARKHWNIYFTVNSCGGREITKKPLREEIAALTWLHVDVDPAAPPEGADADEHYAAERERILAGLRNPPSRVPTPTCITFSGGGYQAFWRLKDPLLLDGSKEQFDDAKLWNKHLELDLGGDNCHNVDRIMRVPGTVNWPDARKRKKGRVPVLAEVIEWSDTPYRRSEFKKAEAVQGNVKGPADAYDPPTNVRRFDSVDDIPELADAPQCRVVIVQGNDPDEPDKFDGSRSEWLFFACCEMVRQGMSDDDIYSVITDPSFAVSDSVIDKGSGVESYAIRQIGRAHEFADDFQTDKDGNPYRNLHNARMAIAKLGVTVEYDEFADRARIAGLPGFGPHLDDAAMTRLLLAIEEQFRLNYPKDRFWMIVQDMGRQNVCHPVREFLDGLVWDGTSRVDGWLSKYLGVAESEYARSVGAIALVAAVRRVRKPGCKFDEMPVLEGEQGGGKSSALRLLAVREDWFSDDLPLNARPQEFIECTVGKWIVEAGELKGMRKGDVESLKSCLSRQVDRARMAYGRLPVERARQFLIFGTTNSEQYLRDSTGNRRFWPVKVGDVDLVSLRRDREQLWAEAAAREASGESIRLAPSLYASAAREQEARRVEDPFVQLLGDALSGIEGKLRAGDAWNIVGVIPGQRSQEHNARLGEAMRELGWERSKRRFGGKPEWSYVKGDGRTELELDWDDLGHVRAVRPAGTGAREVADYWPEPEGGWMAAYRAHWAER